MREANSTGGHAILGRLQTCGSVASTVCRANVAGARELSREMPNANQMTTLCVKTTVYPVEQISLFLFAESSDSVRTQIGKLDHRREMTIHEERCFDYAFYARPHRPSRMIAPHFSRQTRCDCRVILLDDDPDGLSALREESIEPGDNLLESEVEGLLGWGFYLVLCLSKQN